MNPQIKDKLSKRARRKFLNYPLLKHLLALDSPLKKKYETTLTCSHAIKQQDGKITSRYCKRTWCNVCSPIRTAIRINAYRDELEKLPNLQLTTLTAPNCQASEIKQEVQRFRAVFRQFRNTYKKRTGHVFKGVYNFECTYNHKTGLYHPHIHIIHEGLELFEKADGSGFFNNLVTYWLHHSPGSNIKGQDSRPCTDLIEGFKYQSLSIFKIKINGKKQPFVPVVELDAIFQQLSGLRCFQSFGLVKHTLDEEQEEKLFEELTAYESDKPEGVYVWQRHDWHREVVSFDRETGELFDHTELIPLSEFVPNLKTLELYEKLQANQYYTTRNKVP